MKNDRIGRHTVQVPLPKHPPGNLFDEKPRSPPPPDPEMDFHVDLGSSPPVWLALLSAVLIVAVPVIVSWILALCWGH